MSDLPPSHQPYRSAVVFHAVLAGLIVLVAGLSGGDVTKALAVAAVYFVVATGWAWARFRQRERRAARDAAASQSHERR